MDDDKDQSVDIRFLIDGQTVTGTSGKHSVEFDRFLERNDARSFVFIPLAKLKAKKRQKAPDAATLALKKEKLPDGNWIDGELVNRKDGRTVPGVLALDIRRREAREIAEKVGAKQFLWIPHEAPMERHVTKIFEDEDDYSWSSARRRAFDGLRDMFAAIVNMRQLPRAVAESQTTMKRFVQLVGVVIGLVLVAGLAQKVLLESQHWLAHITTVAFYPFVIPAVVVGVYLRSLMKRAESQSRDFTAVEARRNWTLVAPHILALWALCFTAVFLLSRVQSVPTAEMPFLGHTNSVSMSFIVCVWMLLPIAHSRDVKPLLSSAVESGVAAVVSIFVIKISLFVTDLVSDILWDVIAGLVPFRIPEFIKLVFDTVINLGAEVFFLAVLLGYAWSKTRQQFMRL